MNPSWKMWAPAFLLGLALGVVGGSLGQRAMFHRMKNAPDSHRMLERLTAELTLDAAQKDSVLLVLESRKKDFQAMKKEGEERFQAIRTSTNDDIRKVLTPEQRVKFEALVARWEKKHHQADASAPGK